MSDQPETSKRVPGHSLLNEGAGWMCTDDGRYHRNTYDGWGFARCTCGQVSEVLGSTSERKRWHRRHKAAVLAEREQASA